MSDIQRLTNSKYDIEINLNFYLYLFIRFYFRHLFFPYTITQILNSELKLKQLIAYQRAY